MEFLMQPIRRFPLVDEVDKNQAFIDLPAIGTAASFRLRAAEEPPVEFVSADAPICEEQAGMDGRRESLPQLSELSTGKMNPQGLGWSKRDGRRTPWPSKVIALEKPIRGTEDELDVDIYLPTAQACCEGSGCRLVVDGDEEMKLVLDSSG